MGNLEFSHLPTFSLSHLLTFSPLSYRRVHSEHSEDGRCHGCDDFQDYRYCVFAFVTHCCCRFVFKLSVFLLITGRAGSHGMAGNTWFKMRKSLRPYPSAAVILISPSHLFTFSPFHLLTFLTPFPPRRRGPCSRRSWAAPAPCILSRVRARGSCPSRSWSRAGRGCAPT